MPIRQQDMRAADIAGGEPCWRNVEIVDRMMVVSMPWKYVQLLGDKVGVFKGLGLLRLLISGMEGNE